MAANMATFQSLSGHAHVSNKITKPRSKMPMPMVKPILKKLAQSPKNSLDLDRGWEDQPVDLGGWGGGVYESGSAGAANRSNRDVSFQFAPWDAPGRGSSGTATPVGAMSDSSVGAAVPISIGPRTGSASRGRFQHARSTSGTSHVSVATSGSGHRPGGGSFVHPFQQTPRTNTPPLSYANSVTSFDNGTNPRDYSPTVITENEDDETDIPTPLSQSLSSHLHYQPGPSLSSGYPTTNPIKSISQSSLRRPSLASQRTSSLSDIHKASTPPLRANTNSHSRSQPNPPSRLAHGTLNTSYSQSDLRLNHIASSTTDSPRPSITSPISPITSMSPLRSSLDGAAWRLRSRSEVDTGARREDIREARRKFEERERQKEEAYEAEQRRKRERKDIKEAARMEKAAMRKNSEVSGARPSFSRKRTPPLVATSSSTGTRGTKSSEFRRGRMASSSATDEKHLGFMSNNYDSVQGGATPSYGPDVNDVQFKSPKRSHAAKRKTQGYWAGFILWLRTRLLRLGKR